MTKAPADECCVCLTTRWTMAHPGLYQYRCAKCGHEWDGEWLRQYADEWIDLYATESQASQEPEGEDET